MQNRWLIVLVLLAACGTPQQRCISAATRDMRVVDRLIAEAEGNLARGYAYETVTVYLPEWQDCTPRATESNPEPQPELCLEEVAQTTRTPVAIDLNVEAAKLKSLRQKRVEQASAGAKATSDCRAAYPE